MGGMDGGAMGGMDGGAMGGSTGGATGGVEGGLEGGMEGGVFIWVLEVISKPHSSCRPPPISTMVGGAVGGEGGAQLCPSVNQGPATRAEQDRGKRRSCSGSSSSLPSSDSKRHQAKDLQRAEAAGHHRRTRAGSARARIRLHRAQRSVRRNSRRPASRSRRRKSAKEPPL